MLLHFLSLPAQALGIFQLEAAEQRLPAYATPQGYMELLQPPLQSIAAAVTTSHKPPPWSQSLCPVAG
jgi:hypothetical protein